MKEARGLIIIKFTTAPGIHPTYAWSILKYTPNIIGVPEGWIWVFCFSSLIHASVHPVHFIIIKLENQT